MVVVTGQHEGARGGLDEVPSPVEFSEILQRAGLGVEHDLVRGASDVVPAHVEGGAVEVHRAGGGAASGCVGPSVDGTREGDIAPGEVGSGHGVARPAGSSERPCPGRDGAAAEIDRRGCRAGIRPLGGGSEAADVKSAGIKAEDIDQIGVPVLCADRHG